MEYKEMIDKVKALAAQNRAAKSEEDKAEVRRQMDALKESQGIDYGGEIRRGDKHAFHGIHRQGLLREVTLLARTQDEW